MLELPEARTMMAEILQASPDTKFTEPVNCVYFNDDGSPCCAVGHVFSRLNIDKNDLVARKTWQRTNSTSFNGLFPTWHGKISQDAGEFLAEVQALQDDYRMTWGEIFKELYGEANGKD